MPLEAVIGLEVHVQLLTRTKIFCSCPTMFGAHPNTQTCPVCLGMPGALPVLNRRVVELALRAACALSCHLNPVSRFARKHYFYPDLPKGYQISQFELPLAEYGFLEIETPAAGTRRIGISRIHLEEDAGKLLHVPAAQLAGSSSVDYNRAGVPLIEIVTEPDIRSAEEAGAYLRGLHALVQYLGVCDGNMEQGSFRCDANVSVRADSASPLGTRVELKNINSFRFIERAIDYEIERQTQCIRGGGQVAQETRLWDEHGARTAAMRGKEEARDYRYFPDPDLAPLSIDAAWVKRVREDLPELPREKRIRFMRDYGLSASYADLLTRTRQTADYFEQTVVLGAPPRQAGNWIMGEIARTLEDMREIDSCAVTPAHLSELIRMIESGTISVKIAKAVFNEMISSSQFPNTIIEKKGFSQLSDSDEIASIAASVLDQCPAEVQAYQAGRRKLFGFFVGRVMQATGGRANPRIVNDLLRRMLDEHHD